MKSLDLLFQIFIFFMIYYRCKNKLKASLRNIASIRLWAFFEKKKKPVRIKKLNALYIFDPLPLGLGFGKPFFLTKS